MNVQIFGDSIMQGVIYSSESGRYKLRENRFADLIGSGIGVKNNSRMGATIEKGCSCLESKLSECGSDTLVLFEFGGNDCDFDWAKVSDEPNLEHQPHTAPERFTEIYKNAINGARAKGAEVILTTLVPIDAPKYMSFISKGRSYDNIMNWLGDVSMLYRFQEYYSRLVERIAAEMHCPLIDLRSTFLTTHNYRDCLCADGIHPTECGYGMIEAELTKHIMAYA